MPNDIAQRQCYAILRKMEKQFKREEISMEAVFIWNLNKCGYDINGNKSQFKERDWVYLSARLIAAENTPHLFKALCNTIKQESNCLVYRVEENKSKKIFEGAYDHSIINRCQKHADMSDKEVLLHFREDTRKFSPKKGDL